MENDHVLQQEKTQRTLISSEQPDPLVLRNAANRMRVTHPMIASTII